MREILEDAALTYRDELENLFALLIPAVVAGPVALIIAGTGLRAALALVPLLLLLYLGTAAACLRWAGSAAGGTRSGNGTVWALIGAGPDIMLSTAPVTLLLAVAAAFGLFVTDQGFGFLCWPAAAAASGLSIHWLLSHVYELPVVMLYDADARQARVVSARLGDEARRWTARLLALVAAPMAVVALLGLWLSLALSPVVGAAVFLLAGTLWLPFASLCLASACDRVLDDMTQRHQAAQPMPLEQVARAPTPARRRSDPRDA